MTVRTTRFFSRASVEGSVQTVLRSAASVASDSGSARGAGLAASRVDRLLINQNSVDHPAHLDQLLPISAVASETRDLARGDGANLAKTHLRHHPLKASALDPAR